MPLHQLLCDRLGYAALDQIGNQGWSCRLGYGRRFGKGGEGRGRLNQADGPIAAFLAESLILGKRCQEADAFELLNGGFELADELHAAFVVPGKPDVLAGEILEIESPFRLKVKPLSHEAVDSHADDVLETYGEVEIEASQVTGLKAVEHGLVPDNPGAEKSALSVGFPAVVQVYVVDDAEDFAHPRLPPVVPPRILEMVRDTGQAVQGQGDPVVALAFVRPVKQGNEFVAGEVHLAGRKGIL